MKKLMTTAVLGMAVAVQAASPTLSNVNVRQDSSRLVTISYSVDQDCVVTVDVVTNGVSIGAQNFTNMTGAVNKQVSAGANTICWKPKDSWPNQRIAAGGLSVQVKAWPLCAPPPYMVVDLYQDGDGYLGDGVFVHYFASTNAFPGGFGARVYKTTTIVMRHIPAAGVRWRMGMSAADAAAMGSAANDVSDTNFSTVGNVTYAQSETAHYVTLTNDYWIGVYELTQAQGKRLTIDGESYPSSDFSDWTGLDRDLYPMEHASYSQIRGDGWPAGGDTVTSWLPRFRDRTGGMKFDLPTDAQWEFACRAGESAQLYDGSSVYENGSLVANADELVANIGWFKNSYDGGTAVTLDRPRPVGLKAPNAWGLYDMVGNVREWCLDWYLPMSSAEVIDPRGPDSVASSLRRVTRGGGYTSTSVKARSSNRRGSSWGGHSSDVGCRLAIRIP